MKVGDKQKISERNKKYYEANKEKIVEKHKSYREIPLIKEKKRVYAETHRVTMQGKYTWYKGKAKERKIPFDLTLEEFESFWQQWTAASATHERWRWTCAA